MADTICSGSLDELRRINIALGKYNSIYKEGFQAGMKRAAEMAKQTHENSDDLDMYNSGWDAACEEIEQVILKEAND